MSEKIVSIFHTGGAEMQLLVRPLTNSRKSDVAIHQNMHPLNIAKALQLFFNPFLLSEGSLLKQQRR